MPTHRPFSRLALLGRLSFASFAARAQDPLTPEQIRRWQLLDFKLDGVPGISADRAYRELLAGRPPRPC